MWPQGSPSEARARALFQSCDPRRRSSFSCFRRFLRDTTEPVDATRSLLFSLSDKTADVVDALRFNLSLAENLCAGGTGATIAH